VSLFRLFEERHKEILERDPAVVEKVIADSVRLKASVVSADEREGGLRQVLNLGHTIGHALEAETGYKVLLHGEAVGWGMVAATYIALSTGKVDSVTAGRIMNAVMGLGELPRMNVKTANILKRLRSDKKTRQGIVHFILPREIGKVEITSEVPESAVRSAVEEIRKLAGSEEGRLRCTPEIAECAGNCGDTQCLPGLLDRRFLAAIGMTS
jgi:3-dehydroquinate synthase